MATRDAPAHSDAPFQAAAAWSAQGVPFVVAVVTDTGGSTPQLTGALMMVALERAAGTVGGGAFEHLVMCTAREMLAPGGARTRTIEAHLVRDLGMCCGGRMTAFLTRTDPRPALWIFGAGHVGTALAAQARLLDVQVTVVDGRAEWADRGRFSPDVTVLDAEPEDLLGGEALSGPPPGAWVIVTTHAHPLDEAIIRALTPRTLGADALGYLGLIGSRAKWARFRARLQARGVPAAALDRVRCPVGLPVGAQTPAEIAVSILAELVQTRRGASA